MKAEDIVWEYPKGLLNWYDFTYNCKVLYIGNKDSNIAELLYEKCGQVVCVDYVNDLDEKNLDSYHGCFDYIIAIGVLERFTNPIDTLSKWRTLLNKAGKMLLATDNRLGLRYFCGDRDAFTNRSFDGVENYRRVNINDRKFMSGRNYSKAEICEMLDASEWKNRKFYSVLPNYEWPQLIYSEDYVPEEELAIRLFPMYYYPDSVFLEEEFLYTDLIENGLFHSMANTYLIECSISNEFSNISHITLSMDRGKENALATIIRNNKTVEKRILYSEGMDKLSRLKENADDLIKHGINVVHGYIYNNSYIMPYINQEILVPYLRKLAKSNIQLFINEMDKFRNIILQSSEHVDESSEVGVILKKGYLDLVPLNCFNDNGNYLFYDQEFYIENYPANAIIYRSIEIVYMGDNEMETILPRKYFWEKYHLNRKIDVWNLKSYEFAANLRNLKELHSFHEKFQRNYQIINTNRQRMNYSVSDYDKIFVDLFKNAENKKIILFGSGNFTKRFLAQFKKEYNIYAIVDNNQDKWNTVMDGIVIQPPDILTAIPEDERRIIICVKGYMGIVNQLKQMGIQDYCIYDTNIQYPRKQRENTINKAEKDILPKKYHIGYISGVFDLFHIGHLNMFKKAKEQCDYLIVGVVTDEGVIKYKKTTPFIPFTERLELVSSCRYVDEAVEIPVHYGGSRDAHNIYHFDVQFSGSDYIDDPVWIGEKEYLKKQGADLVFFPYTEGTSSTKLKKMIEESFI